MDGEIPDVDLVGGGLAEWPAGQGPRGETVAPAAFVDVSGHDTLLDLPHAFHDAGAAAWRCHGAWEASPPALVVAVEAPVEATFRIPLDPAKHGPLVEAALRDGTLYICTTSPRLGLNARMARDRSFPCTVDQTFAETWRSLRPQHR